MNLDTWNALPKDVQDAIDKVNEEWWVRWDKVWFDHNKMAYEYAKKQGVETIRLSDEELARWMEKIKPLQDKWLTMAKAKGLPAEEILDEVLRLVDKYNKQYPYTIFD
ncbi:hypothetical protein ES703_110934 [subsurface metagenome]